MGWQDRAKDLHQQGLTYAQVADHLRQEYAGRSFTGLSVRGWLRRHGHTQSTVQTETVTAEPGESFELRADGTGVSDKLISIMAGEKITPKLIMERHGLDPTQWAVISYRNNLWHGQKKGGDRIIQYQSRLTVKAIDGVKVDDVRELFADLERHSPIVKVDYPQVAIRRKMAEVNVADLHLAKMCWRGNTGENYDHKIAKKNFEGIVERICEELSKIDLEYILFVWSNDYFNSDNEASATTKGTSQDTDIRFEKMFKVGTAMLCWAIERLKQIAPVRTFRTPSNHDNVLSLTALVVLQAWFRNDPQVQIDNDVMPRKYILYGNSLTGYCHGDTEGKESTSKDKASRLASLMPAEARDLWGKALYCEMHVGHLHSEQMIQEINSVIVRRISSPTATDTWHTENGYVGSTRKAQTFIYDRSDHIVQIIHTHIRQTDRVLT